MFRSYSFEDSLHTQYASILYINNWRTHRDSFMGGWNGFCGNYFPGRSSRGLLCMWHPTYVSNIGISSGYIFSAGKFKSNGTIKSADTLVKEWNRVEVDVASIFGLNLFVSPKLYKDMTAYQRILLKLVTDHPTSQNRMDCLTHVWSGPMGPWKDM